MNERNQPSEAGSQSGIPDEGGNRRGIRPVDGENANLFDQTTEPGAGGVNTIGNAATGQGRGIQALPHGWDQISSARHLAIRCEIITTKINVAVDQAAAKAQAECKAMAESARRSIGQLTRKDNRERRAGK